MVLVGPRPNVPREVVKYTLTEENLLSVKPGITDLSSVALSDLGVLLAGEKDPNLAYEKKIRPFKSELALVYVIYPSTRLFFLILALTLYTQLSPARARNIVRRSCIRYNISIDLQKFLISNS